MSDNKNKHPQKVEEFFANPANAKVSVVYMTSDGHLFRAEHYANNWKANNHKMTVGKYFRQRTKVGSELDTESTSNIDNDQAPNVEESNPMKSLINEYIELFDTKPASNMSESEIRAEIDSKKLELDQEEDKDEDNSELESSAIATLEDEYLKLFGKKPHHMKSEATIRAEIEAKKLELEESGNDDSNEGDSDQGDTKNPLDENANVNTLDSEESNSGN